MENYKDQCQWCGRAVNADSDCNWCLSCFPSQRHCHPSTYLDRDMQEYEGCLYFEFSEPTSSPEPLWEEDMTDA